MRGFTIDYLPESAARYTSSHAIVAIDVIRATTMAVTAVEIGHICHSVTSVDEAFALAGNLVNPLLAGELKGYMPVGFDMNNSPAELVLRGEVDRPLILLSSSGTQLLRFASGCHSVYVACLRNYVAVSRYIATRHERIALIGAGSRGQFREEDQLCCAWMGAQLMQAGYSPEDQQTARWVDQWQGASVAACGLGDSAAYLQRTHQLDDLDFILSHVNDLNSICVLDGQEIVKVAAPELDTALSKMASVGD